jgi:hypothetical protein
MTHDDMERAWNAPHVNQIPSKLRKMISDVHSMAHIVAEVHIGEIAAHGERTRDLGAAIPDAVRKEIGDLKMALHDLKKKLNELAAHF